MTLLQQQLSLIPFSIEKSDNAIATIHFGILLLSIIIFFYRKLYQ